MANLNRIILIGRLVAEPEARFTVDGTPITKFRLAVNRFLSKTTSQATDFIDIVAWRRLAEICGQFLKKGKLVLIEGRIHVRSYDDSSGQRKWVTEVIARNMQMLEGPEKEAKEIAATASEDLDLETSASSVEPLGPKDTSEAFEDKELTVAGEDLPF